MIKSDGKWNLTDNPLFPDIQPLRTMWRRSSRSRDARPWGLPWQARPGELQEASCKTRGELSHGKDLKPVGSPPRGIDPGHMAGELRVNQGLSGIPCMA